MRDTTTASFVQRVVGGLPQDAASQPEWRPAFVMEREGGGQAFCISVRSVDGRDAEGFAMSLYIRHKWLDRSARVERLVLYFSTGAICIEGEHLQRGLDALEEGKLKRIQPQDSNEIALVRSHNADNRHPDKKEPIVSRVVVSPSLDSLLESDDNLADIAKHLKEDYAGHN
jgi:hypothetical protein